MDSHLLQSPTRRFTEEEFFNGEGQEADVRYEFVDGRIYPEEHATDRHCFISANIGVALHAHLKGKHCRVFLGNMLLRIKFINRTAHYIPDIIVACDKPPRDKRYREEPLLLVEVISKSTREKDEREKLFAYSSVASLKHYLMVKQDSMEISHYWRDENGWQEEALTQPEHFFTVPELDFTLSLADVYADVSEA